MNKNLIFRLLKQLFYSMSIIICFYILSFADEIYLKDSRIIKGKIIQITNNNIEYSEEEGKPFLIVTKNLVSKIVYDNGNVVQIEENIKFDKIIFKDGSVIEGKVLQITPDAVIYNPANSNSKEAVALEYVVKIIHPDGKEIGIKEIQEKSKYTQKQADNISQQKKKESISGFISGEIVLYPSAGVGISLGSAKAISGADMGTLINNDSSLFNNPGVSYEICWNAGIGVDYFLFRNLAITSGLYYEDKPFSMVYPKNTAYSDLEMSIDFQFLTIPLGLRYYFSKFFIGGGLYYSILLSYDAEINYGYNSQNVTLNNLKNDFGFFTDFGMNFNLEDDINFLVFCRFEGGLVNVYSEHDILTNIKLATITLNFAFGFKI